MRRLLPLVLALGWVGAALAQTPQAPQVAVQPEDTIVVLDLSGSMREADYGDGRPRVDVARDTLDEFLEQRVQAGHTRRIGLVTFGWRYSWRNTISPDYTERLGRNVRSIDVPASSPYCADVHDTVGLRTFDADAVREIRRQAARLEPNGMTPVLQALEAAAGMLDRSRNNEIVLISDWDERNCVPPNVDLCGRIRDLVDGFTREGGTVRLRLITTPRSDTISILENCHPMPGVDVPRDDPDPDEPIERLLDRTQVIFVPFFTRNVLGDRKPRRAGSRLEITGPDPQGNRQSVYQGALGQVPLHRGRNSYRWTIEGESGEGTIRVPQDTRVAIPLNPPEVRFLVTSFDNKSLPQGAILKITEHATGIVLFDEQIGVSRVLSFAPGRYRIAATLEGQTASLPADVINGVLTLGLGGTQTVPLKFDAVPKQIPTMPGTFGPGGRGGAVMPVAVHLTLGRPGLFADLYTPPVVVLDGTGRHRLSAGSQTLDLAPGRWRVKLSEGALEGGWDLTLPASADAPPEVTIVARPGWLHARTDAQAGTLTLIHAGGRRAAIAGQIIDESLPSGDYFIEFTSTASAQPRREPVRIVPGRGTVLRIR